MSTDIWLVDSDGQAVGESLNFTSNTSDLWYDHMDGGLIGLDGNTGREAALKLRQAFFAIERTRIDLCCDKSVGETSFCAKYDSPNGWGTAVGGLLFLARILGECAKHETAIVRVSV